MAIGIALVQILWERTLAKVPRTAPDERYLFADYARGLALLAALAVQFCWMASRDGSSGFANVYLVLNPIALPAFMVVSGLLARRTPVAGYTGHLAASLHCLAAIAIWSMFQIGGAFMTAPQGAMSFALAKQAIGSMTDEIAPLILVPAFAIIAQSSRHHRWGVLALAVLAEMLVIPGRTFGGEFMRGLVYFYVGFLFGPSYRLMAREAKTDVQMTFCAMAIWLALAIVSCFIRIPAIGDATLASLPFASLGFGGAGSMVAVMGAALMVENRIFPALAEIGRRWIVVATAVPLAVQALRFGLVKTHAAASYAAADLVIGVAVAAALAAAIVPLLLTSLPKQRPLFTDRVSSAPHSHGA